MWLMDAFHLYRQGLESIAAAWLGLQRIAMPGPDEEAWPARAFFTLRTRPVAAQQKELPTNRDAAHDGFSAGKTFKPVRPAHQGFFASLRNRPQRRVSRALPLCLVISGCAVACASRPSTAFFYGAAMPVAALAQFDRVVVEAENVKDLDGLRAQGADVFAYVSVGEAEGWRASSSALPAELFLGTNPGWGSRIADLTQPRWREYLIEQRMAQLWASGYRGFFLDTLDSYERVVTDPHDQRLQSQALVGIIRATSQRFPGVKLLFNRGFAILPEAAPLAVGLVAESLFQGWNPLTQQYQPVSENDRRWLTERLNEVRHRYGLPITVIDYVPPDKPQLAQETARQISALGFTPWVSTPGLDILGVGVEGVQGIKGAQGVEP
jgi:hypothetical protein